MEYNLISAFEIVGSKLVDVLLVKDIYTGEPVVLKACYGNLEVEILKNLCGLSFVPKFIRNDTSDKAPKEIWIPKECKEILIMEYIPGYNLQQIIERSDSKDEDDIINFLKKLPMMFKQIADKGVIHGDINWNNIRIDNKSDVYIIDFGESFIIDPHSDSNHKFIKEEICDIIKLYEWISEECDFKRIKQLAKIDHTNITSYEELDKIVQSICAQ